MTDTELKVQIVRKVSKIQNKVEIQHNFLKNSGSERQAYIKKANRTFGNKEIHGMNIKIQLKA